MFIAFYNNRCSQQSINRCHLHQHKAPGTYEFVRGFCYFLDMFYQEALRMFSESKQKKQTKFCTAVNKVSNTGLKSRLRAIAWYTYCLDYLYFTPRYGFPKSNSTVPTFYKKLQWRGWYCVILFNDQVHTTHHPVLNFLGIYMSPVQWYPSLFFGAQQLTALVSVHIMV